MHMMALFKLAFTLLPNYLLLFVIFLFTIKLQCFCVFLFCIDLLSIVFKVVPTPRFSFTILSNIALTRCSHVSFCSHKLFSFCSHSFSIMALLYFHLAMTTLLCCNIALLVYFCNVNLSIICSVKRLPWL
jgi:hypothetical protein